MTEHITFCLLQRIVEIAVVIFKILLTQRRQWEVPTVISSRGGICPVAIFWGDLLVNLYSKFRVISSRSSFRKI